MVSPGWAGELLPPLGRCVLSKSQDSLIHLHNLPGPMDVWASLGAQMVKCLPAMEETRVRSLGQEDPLEKEMATHCSILAWRIPWTEEPGGLQSMWSQRVGHDWATSLSFFLSMGVWIWDPWCCEQMLWIIASFLFYFLKLWQIYITHSFPGGSDSKESASNMGDPGLIRGLGWFPAEGNGNSLWYSCLENPMDRGALWATVCGIAKSQTQLSD